MDSQDKIQVAIADFKLRSMKSWQVFPWDWFQFTIPSFGPTHSYLCTYLAKYGNPYEMLFLPQKPSMRELERFMNTHEEHYLAKSIFKNCQYLYDLRAEDRSSVQAEVLRFMINNNEFMNEYEALLQYKGRLGYFG